MSIPNNTNNAIYSQVERKNIGGSREIAQTLQKFPSRRLAIAPGLNHRSQGLIVWWKKLQWYSHSIPFFPFFPFHTLLHSFSLNFISFSFFTPSTIQLYVKRNEWKKERRKRMHHKTIQSGCTAPHRTTFEWQRFFLQPNATTKLITFNNVNDITI